MWKPYLALVLYLTLCVGVGLLISILTPSVCISQKCLKKTQLILDDMDSSIKACDNFYQFICGNYEGPKTKGTKEESVWEELKEKQIQRLVNFLQEPLKKRDDRVLKVLKKMYTSCLDTDYIEREGVKPLLFNIQKAGGFPLVDGRRWNKRYSGTTWSLNEIEYVILDSGFSGGKIFKSFVKRYEDRGNDYYVYLTPPSNLEFAESHSKDYYNYVVKICTLLEGRSCSGNKDKEIMDTLGFKSKLTKITKKVENCSGLHYHENLDSFSKEFPFLGLKNFLTRMFPNIKVKTLPEKVVVSYDSKDYFYGVKDLLKTTPERILSNYLMIENIMEVTPMLPSGFREAYDELVKNIEGSSFRIERNRKKICVKCIKDKVSSALSALYLRAHFTNLPRIDYLQNVLISLKVQMRKLVHRIQWMDRKTKQRAIAKVNILNVMTPLPEDVFNSLVKEVPFRIYYEDLCFTGSTSDTLTAYLALQQFTTDKNWELFERMPEVFDTNVDIFSAEIKFDHVRNLAVVPMGFLQFPAFNRMWPNYLNYGGFCSKVAMELFKSIDYSGSQYGTRGEPRSWWSIETKAEYGKETRCFINQYNDYIQPETDVKLKDLKCVEDQEALLAGVEVAYNAYVTYDGQRFFPERKLQKLKQYSSQQLFFIDFATFYCAASKRHYYYKMTELEASKTSNEYKVIGAVQNFKPFSNLFGCHQNETMNPSGKCNIWGSN